MDGWNTTFLLGWPIFRGELLVSGRVPLTLDNGFINVGIELGLTNSVALKEKQKQLKKKHTAVFAVLIHSPCNFEGIARYSEYLVPLFVFGGCLVRF